MHRIGSSLLLLALSVAAPAFAYLGGDYNSVQVDRASIKARLRTTTSTQYDVHELTSDAGTTVREYVSSAGKVFAVTWQGFVMPNLQQLLGANFSEYQAAAQAASRPGAHRGTQIAHPGLVVQSAGRLRNFHGRAYVPDLVPTGVSIADLK